MSGRPQMTIWRKSAACWISKATNTHWEYVIPIAFTQQQWLQESASLIRYTYIVCLVHFSDGLFNPLSLLLKDNIGSFLGLKQPERNANHSCIQRWSLRNTWTISTRRPMIVASVSLPLYAYICSTNSRITSMKFLAFGPRTNNDVTRVAFLCPRSSAFFYSETGWGF